jgi:predicted oxidoreductase
MSMIRAAARLAHIVTKDMVFRTVVPQRLIQTANSAMMAVPLRFLRMTLVTVVKLAQLVKVSVLNATQTPKQSVRSAKTVSHTMITVTTRQVVWYVPLVQ